MGTDATHLFPPRRVLWPGAAAHAKDAERHQTRRKRTLEQGASVSALSRPSSLRIVVRCVPLSDADAVRGEKLVIKRGLHVCQHWDVCTHRTTCTVSQAGGLFSQRVSRGRRQERCVRLFKGELNLSKSIVFDRCKLNQ